jgi:protein ImuA
VRNDVPGGGSGLLVLPAGVEERAGGAPGRVLIEELRASIRALEQVPVSLGLPPVPGAAPPHPACSLPYSPAGLFTSPLEGRANSCGMAAISSPSPKGEGEDGRWPSPGGGFVAALPVKSHPLPGPPPSRGRESPLHKLKQGGLHEIKPEAYRDGPAALAFALAVIAEEAARTKRRDLVLWCLTQDAVREWGRPYGPGLCALGLDPALFLIVEARNVQDAAWALEEGLKSCALIAALAQIEIKAPIVARRLGLAAQASRTPCLLVSRHQRPGLPGTLTRWRIAAQRSGPAPCDAQAPGDAPSWHLTLDRCRGEAPGRSFIVEFSHESFRFRLSAASSDRAAQAREAGHVRTG